MAGFVLLLSFVLSMFICCILIVSSSKTATTHSGNVMVHAKTAYTEQHFFHVQYSYLRLNRFF
jgi:hypothetical protein